jgi:3-deoxy-D-manno-octulosonic-acid transferase
MYFLYNFIIHSAGFILKIVAVFNPKIKLFVDGRKSVFAILSEKIKPSDKTIWFHAASLGEYEQGLPVIEKLKEKCPNHKIVVTFFSPSGFEVRKNNKIADVTVYLPLDTKNNAKAFLKLVHPTMVFFIKYEYWPNYLNELQKLEIPTYLISGIFREDQLFFKWYGGFYKNALKTFDYFFVQNESSKKLLQSIGFQNVKFSGDTRFDRVSKILSQDNAIDIIEQFKNNTLTIVVGSSWPKDENNLMDFINTNPYNVKFIIAPHNIKEEQITNLKNQISKKIILHSEVNSTNLHLNEFDVMIVNSIGFLTKIYSYADIAYVGGGFGTAGLHNILEPATFGIPVLIGPNFEKFSEAVALVHLGGCISVKSKKELEENLAFLIQNEDERIEKGHIASTFVKMNEGATKTILNYLNATE